MGIEQKIMFILLIIGKILTFSFTLVYLAFITKFYLYLKYGLGHHRVSIPPSNYTNVAHS
jgi:hypothetical protein